MQLLSESAQRWTITIEHCPASVICWVLWWEGNSWKRKVKDKPSDWSFGDFWVPCILLMAAGPDSAWIVTLARACTGIGLLAILSCIHIPLAGDTLHTTLAVSNILRTTFIHIFKLVGRLLGKFWENVSIGTSKYFFAGNWWFLGFSNSFFRVFFMVIWGVKQ